MLRLFSDDNGSCLEVVLNSMCVLRSVAGSAIVGVLAIVAAAVVYSKFTRGGGHRGYQR